jgi:hypothetical protein
MPWYRAIPGDESDLEATLANDSRQTSVEDILLFHLLSPSAAEEMKYALQSVISPTWSAYNGIYLRKVGNLPKKRSGGNYGKSRAETPYDTT